MKRFWDKVKIVEDVCWEWQAGIRGKSGYGTFKYNGRAESAHRMSWVLTNGAILNGLWVLHKCDNRKCVNPSHLFLGTAKDNMQDCARIFPREPKIYGYNEKIISA